MTIFFFALEHARDFEEIYEDLLFFGNHLQNCVLGPWPREFLFLTSKGSVLGKSVFGHGLGFFCVFDLGLEPCVLDTKFLSVLWLRYLGSQCWANLNMQFNIVAIKTSVLYLEFLNTLSSVPAVLLAIQFPCSMVDFRNSTLQKCGRKGTYFFMEKKTYKIEQKRTKNGYCVNLLLPE